MATEITETKQGDSAENGSGGSQRVESGAVDVGVHHVSPSDQRSDAGPAHPVPESTVVAAEADAGSRVELEQELDELFSATGEKQLSDVAQEVLLAQAEVADNASLADEEASAESNAEGEGGSDSAGDNAMGAGQIGLIGLGLIGAAAAGGGGSSSAVAPSNASATPTEAVDATTSSISFDDSASDLAINVEAIPAQPINAVITAKQIEFVFTGLAEGEVLALDESSQLVGALVVESGTVDVTDANTSGLTSITANSGVVITASQLEEAISNNPEFTVSSESTEASTFEVAIESEADIEAYNSFLKQGGLPVSGSGAQSIELAGVVSDSISDDLKASAEQAAAQPVPTLQPGEAASFSIETLMQNFRSAEDQESLPDDYRINLEANTFKPEIQSLAANADSYEAAKSFIDGALNSADANDVGVEGLVDWEVRDTAANFIEYLNAPSANDAILNDASRVRVSSEDAIEILEADTERAFSSNGGLSVEYQDEDYNDQVDPSLSPGQLDSFLGDFGFVVVFDRLMPDSGEIIIDSGEFLSASAGDIVDGEGATRSYRGDGELEIRLFPETETYPNVETLGFDLSNVADSLMVDAIITGEGEGTIDITGFSSSEEASFNALDNVEFIADFSDNVKLIGSAASLSGLEIKAGSAEGVSVRVEDVDNSEATTLDLSKIFAESRSAGSLEVALNISGEADLTENANFVGFDKLEIGNESTVILDADDFPIGGEPVEVTGNGSVEVIGLSSAPVDLSGINVDGSENVRVEQPKNLGSFGTPNDDGKLQGLDEDSLLFEGGEGIAGAVATVEYFREEFEIYTDVGNVGSLVEPKDGILALKENPDYADYSATLNNRADSLENLYEQAAEAGVGDVFNSYAIVKLSDGTGSNDILFESAAYEETNRVEIDVHASVEVYESQEAFLSALRGYADQPESGFVGLSGASKLTPAEARQFWDDMVDVSQDGGLLGNPDLPADIARQIYGETALVSGQEALMDAYTNVVLDARTKLDDSTLLMDHEEHVSVTAGQANGASIKRLNDEFAIQMDTPNNDTESLHATLYVDGVEELLDADYSGINVESVFNFGYSGETITLDETFKSTTGYLNVEGNIDIDATQVLEDQIGPNGMTIIPTVSMTLRQDQINGIGSNGGSDAIEGNDAAKVTVTEVDNELDLFVLDELNLTLQLKDDLKVLELEADQLARDRSGDFQSVIIQGESLTDVTLIHNNDKAITGDYDFSHVDNVSNNAEFEVFLRDKVNVIGSDGNNVFKINDTLSTGSVIDGGDGGAGLVFGESMSDPSSSEKATVDMSDVDLRGVELLFLEGGGTEVTFSGGQLSNQAINLSSKNETDNESQTVVVKVDGIAGDAVETDLSQISPLNFSNDEGEFAWSEKDQFEIRGGQSDDTIIGPDFSSTIRGGAGLDTMTGGKGADTFVINEGESGSAKIVDSSLTDSGSSQEETIDFDAPLESITDFTFGEDVLELTSEDIDESVRVLSSLEDFANADMRDEADGGVAIAFGRYEQSEDGTSSFTYNTAGDLFENAEFSSSSALDVIIFADDESLVGDDSSGPEDDTASWFVLTGPTNVAGDGLGIVDDPVS